MAHDLGGALTHPLGHIDLVTMGASGSRRSGKSQGIDLTGKARSSVA